MQTRPNLFVLPNSKSSEELVPYLMNLRQREFALADVLDTASNDYDWIFLDTPPSANLLHDLALISSEYVIIPTIMDYFSIGGLKDTLDTIAAVGQLRGVKAPYVLGILPTRVDLRTKETKTQLADLALKVGSTHMLPPIPEDLKVREASGKGLTLWVSAQKTLPANKAEHQQRPGLQ